MISLKTRPAGREKGAIEEIQTFGWNEFCRREGMSGYALQKWFQQQPGHETEKVSYYTGKSIGVRDLPKVEQIKLSVLKERHDYEIRIERLRAEHEAQLSELRQALLQAKGVIRQYQEQDSRSLNSLLELFPA